MGVRSRLSAALAATVIVTGGLTAVAAPVAASGESFYTPPATLPGSNGEVVRSEPAVFHLDPLKALRAPAAVHRIMYRSSDRLGTPIAVTGTVLVPHNAWSGDGPRPLVAYAVGTQGLGDQCAPSRQLAAGTEYEGLFIKGLLARGYAVVVTDYQGLGTPGVHTYISREVTGRAVLDGIRAAQALPAAGLADDGPVAITGYSQGGGAAAAAAELAPSYAPELDVEGVVAGAIPGDLDAVAHNLDGSLYFAFLGYAVAGLAESYDIDTDAYLNDRGEQALAALEKQCTVESVAAFPFVRSSSLTEDGRPITALLGEEPFRTAVGEQLIGVRRPAAPMLVTHSLLDDVIPYAVGRGVAERWCDRGATVRLATNVAPTHVGGALHSYPESFAFLEARFAGWRPLSSCWRL